MNAKIALITSLIAGLSTMLGSTIALFSNKKSNKLIITSLAFSSSIMFFISILDLIPESLKYIGINNSLNKTFIIIITSLIAGVIISYLLDKILPENNNLKKISILSFLTIVIHNIPEGIATFVTTYENINIGFKIALAICLHNIPEGICIALPIYYTSSNKNKVFLYTFVASIAEPFGALTTYLFLKNYINSTSIGILFSLISGLMIYISIIKLLPESLTYKKKTLTIISFLIGTLFFLISFIIF